MYFLLYSRAPSGSSARRLHLDLRTRSREPSLVLQVPSDPTQCAQRPGLCHFKWRAGHCGLVTYRFFPDGFVAGGDGCDAVAGNGGGGGEADRCGGGEADRCGGGEADRCGDVVFSFRFFALSVVCCRGSLG